MSEHDFTVNDRAACQTNARSAQPSIYIRDSSPISQAIPCSVATDPNRLLTAREARALLGIGATTFNSWVALGYLPRPLRIGRSKDISLRHRRWRYRDIVALIVDADASRGEGA